MSATGDVNSDRFPDLLVGCYRWDITGDNEEGKAVVYFTGALGGTITCTVTDSGTNDPLQGATDSANTGQRATTNANGEYALNAVPGGNPSVTASAVSYVPKNQKANVTDGGAIVLDFALEQDPTVGTGATKGKVTDATTGRNLAGGLVETDTGQSATTSKNGRYRIEDVPEGVREVTASKVGSTETRTVTVTAGEKVPLDFALGS